MVLKGLAQSWKMSDFALAASDISATNSVSENSRTSYITLISVDTKKVNDGACSGDYSSIPWEAYNSAMGLFFEIEQADTRRDLIIVHGILLKWFHYFSCSLISLDKKLLNQLP